MNDETILATFSRILSDLLADNVVLSMETVRADVPGWDSFTYVNFIVAVEIEYGIKFRVTDVDSFRNVGEIAAATRALLA